MDDSFRVHGNIGGHHDNGGGPFGGYYFHKGGDVRIRRTFPGVSSDELRSRTRLKERLAGA
jgi:hypothetical protein